MSFFEEYRYLDVLCRDMFRSDRGVSSYIEEMERSYNGAGLVPGWDSDYKQLKHCRWARNQLAHEDVYEYEVCHHGDTEWVIDFYDRIMDRTDPLALYRKAVESDQYVRRRTMVQEEHSEKVFEDKALSRSDEKRPKAFWITAAAIAVISFCIAFFGRM